MLQSASRGGGGGLVVSAPGGVSTRGVGGEGVPGLRGCVPGPGGCVCLVLGGVCSGGCLVRGDLLGGVCQVPGGCLVRGVSQHALSQTPSPPPCGQNS